MLTSDQIIRARAKRYVDSLSISRWFSHVAKPMFFGGLLFTSLLLFIPELTGWAHLTIMAIALALYGYCCIYFLRKLAKELDTAQVRRQVIALLDEHCDAEGSISLVADDAPKGPFAPIIEARAKLALKRFQESEWHPRVSKPAAAMVLIGTCLLISISMMSSLRPYIHDDDGLAPRFEAMVTDSLDVMLDAKEPEPTNPAEPATPEARKDADAHPQNKSANESASDVASEFKDLIAPKDFKKQAAKSQSAKKNEAAGDGIKEGKAADEPEANLSPIEKAEDKGAASKDEAGLKEGGEEPFRLERPTRSGREPLKQEEPKLEKYKFDPARVRAASGKGETKTIRAEKQVGAKGDSEGETRRKVIGGIPENAKARQLKAKQPARLSKDEAIFLRKWR